MKHDIIRDSLNENLSGLHVSRQRQIEMIEEITGGRKMKKKISAGVVLVAALLLLSMTALAVTTNLFGYFAKDDARYGYMAEQAGNVTAEPVAVESDALGKVNARIDSAYYDGESLSVGFIIESASRVEAFIPTEEDLAQAIMIVDPVRPLADTPEKAEIFGAYSDAVEAGVPYGYMMCSVSAHDATYANETELPPHQSVQETNAAGAFVSIRDFAALPADLQNQDSLTLSIPLYETRQFLYFDGTEAYHYSITQPVEIGSITAVVPRTDKAEARKYSGECEINGVQFKAEAMLSSVSGSLVINTYPNFFQMETFTLDGQSWQEFPWALYIYDENGSRISIDDGYDPASLNPLQVKLEGTGSLPAELHIYLRKASGPDSYFEYWPNADAGLENEHIILKIAG